MSIFDRANTRVLECGGSGGYAVLLASPGTKRAAYMTGNGTEITADEKLAAVLPKNEASLLMVRLFDSQELLYCQMWDMARLVPVCPEHPLSSLTSGGF